MRHCMKSLALCTGSGSSQEFLISIPPSCYSFFLLSQASTFVTLIFCTDSLTILKLLVGRKVFLCKVFRDEHLFKLCLPEEKPRRSGLTFFVGILSLRNSASRHNTFHGACIFTNPTPWILVFKKKQEKRLLMRGNKVF